MPDPRVVQSLGLGLDEMAIAAVKKWRIAPSTLAGKSVASVRTVAVDFALPDKQSRWHLIRRAVSICSGKKRDSLSSHTLKSGVRDTHRHILCRFCQIWRGLRPPSPLPLKSLFHFLDEILCSVRATSVSAFPQFRNFLRILLPAVNLSPGLRAACALPVCKIQDARPILLAQQMSRRARPAVLLGTIHNPGPARICLHVSQPDLQVRRRHRTGMKSRLPQVTAPASANVQRL